MKRWILIFGMAQGIVFGGAVMTTPSAIQRTKPVAANQPQVGSTGTTVSNQTSTHPLVMRFRQVMVQIQKAHKAKTLTDAQAQDLRSQVMVIRKQEIAEMKQNGSRTLTEAQISDLNGQLDKVSNSIH